MINIWVISDTHTNQMGLEIPNDIDIVIHAGDSTNSKSPYENILEAKDFLIWFDGLPIKYKILVGGNHDFWLTNTAYRRALMESYPSIIYLENEYIEIEGIKIFGTPFTPTFGDWYFMKSKEKLGKMFSLITEPMDILVSHGPPKGILDIAPRGTNVYEHVGDNALLNLVKKLRPKYHIFGHIHNLSDKYTINEGVLNTSKFSTTFINASCCTDGLMGLITSHGHIINYNKEI